MHNEIIRKAEEIIKQDTVHFSPESSEPYCALALIDADGYPTVSTITPSMSGGIHWVTFCSGLESNKAHRIEKCNRACLCFNKDGAHNITLVGTMEIVTDPAVKQEMWYAGMGNHFSGYDDPNYCVLRFTTRSYNLFVNYQEAKGIV